ncbi:MAG: hypothetical protein ACLR1T_14915 [Evtepia gabavorous]
MLPTFVPEGRRGLASLGASPAACCCCCWSAVSDTWRGLVPHRRGERAVWYGPGLPPLRPARPALPEELAHRKVSLYVGIELLLLLALFGVACLYTGGTWFLSAALWTVFGLGIALLPPAPAAPPALELVPAQGGGLSVL